LRRGAGFRDKRDRPILPFLRTILLESPARTAGVLALTLLLQGAAFAMPALVAYVLDTVIPRRSLSALGVVVAGVPVLAAAYAFSAGARGWMMAALAGQVSRAWLDRIFRHLLRLPLPFFHGPPAEEPPVRVQGADLVLDEMLDQVLAALLDAVLAVTA